MRNSLVNSCRVSVHQKAWVVIPLAPGLFPLKQDFFGRQSIFPVRAWPQTVTVTLSHQSHRDRDPWCRAGFVRSKGHNHLSEVTRRVNLPETMVSHSNSADDCDSPRERFCGPAVRDMTTSSPALDLPPAVRHGGGMSGRSPRMGTRSGGSNLATVFPPSQSESWLCGPRRTRQI
jgi:hypothetical protein